MRGKNMTVKELIEELSKYDENSRVWSSNDKGLGRVRKVVRGVITMKDDVIIKE